MGFEVNTYEHLLNEVLEKGADKEDRTGTGTLSLFGAQLRFDLQKGLPLVTTKKVHFKSVVAELLWFLSGSTNVKDLQALGCSIWDEWADEDGELGPIYGKQWRSWETTGGGSVDQIAEVMFNIKRDPDSRRHIVSAWNVSDLCDMALQPCHTLFQFYVIDGRLSCQLYQRSADIFLGLPFNLASYSLLTHMVAQQCDLEAGEFIWTGGDVHLYRNHVIQAYEQLKRKAKPFPRIRIYKAKDIFSYTPEDFELLGYQPYPAIKATVAV